MEKNGTIKKILIADDHAVVRKGLKQIIAEAFLGVEIFEAVSGPEVEQIAGKEYFDVIIMDISMPGKTGLDVLKELKQNHVNSPILILSIYNESQYAVRALKAGASGFLNKESAPDELVKAIETLLQGRKYITPSIAERLTENFTLTSDKPLHEKLSDREFQVLCFIAKGKTVSEISTELMLSTPTISTYRSRILEKMALKNNSELTFYAIQTGLI